MEKLIGTSEILAITNHNIATFTLFSSQNCLYPGKTLEILSQPHRSNHFFFYYQVEGTSRHWVDGKLHELSKGQLLFIRPGQVHHPQQNSMMKNAHFKLFFKEDVAFKFLNVSCLAVCSQHISVCSFFEGEQRRILWLLETLYSVRKNNRLALHYLNLLMVEFEMSHPTQPNSHDTVEIHLFSRFCKHVGKHLSMTLSIAEIAKDLGVSYSKLYKNVYRFSNASPRVFLKDLLQVEAKRQLLYTSNSIKEIAFDLGFSDPDYFSRFFKQNVGKSASAFREEISRE